VCACACACGCGFVYCHSLFAWRLFYRAMLLLVPIHPCFISIRVSLCDVACMGVLMMCCSAFMGVEA
jgi:hypothetical protein